MTLWDELEHWLIFDFQKGKFYWRFNRGAAYAGSELGWVIVEGNTSYRVCTFSGQRFQVHRLIWFFFWGVWPKNLIDHEDGNGLNNTICNLREANKSQNAANGIRHTDARVLPKGVTFVKRDGKYKAQIFVCGKQKYLGHFDSPEEAELKYKEHATAIFQEFAKK